MFYFNRIMLKVRNQGAKNIYFLKRPYAVFTCTENCPLPPYMIPVSLKTEKAAFLLQQLFIATALLHKEENKN